MYIDIALVKFDYAEGQYLFQAPAWSALEEGDKVLVHDETQEATVKATFTLDTNDEVFDFILKITGARLPLAKIDGKVKLQKFNY